MGAPVMRADAPQVDQSTRRRPWTVLLIGALFLALGCLDLYRSGAPLVGTGRLASDDLLVGLIGVAALVGAGFLLAGRNWARWLLVAWMALHVVISWPDVGKLLGHVLIFGGLIILLFRPAANAYFRGGA